MQKDEKGFFYPSAVPEKCVNCGACVTACPILHMPKINKMNLAFGAFAKDKEERQSSSSGGVFAVLARQVLKEGGVVCGAAFDEQYAVHHIIIEREEDLQKIKGTKYVQSRMDSCFREVMKKLRKGRRVLFSGTPCQVAGLKGFLGQDYQNLFCIDLICHGVPSPGIWEKYLLELAKERVIEQVSFRKKDGSQAKAKTEVLFKDGSLYREVYIKDVFNKGFLNNLFVRPSCFHCHFKGNNHCSDLTIGDFWGVDSMYPGFSETEGTSVLLFHTISGLAGIKTGKSQLKMKWVPLKKAVMWNDCFRTSVQEHPNSTAFFEDMKKNTVKTAIQNNLNEPD